MRPRDLPEPLKVLLRDQIDTAIRLHETSGLPILECRLMVLDAGGLDDIGKCIDNLNGREP